MKYKYDFKIDIDSNGSQALILKQIKPNSTVLEFGCANGIMTQYMQRELNCNIYIVEINPHDYEQAIKFAKDGVLGDAVKLNWLEKFKNIKFDYILFADVLEHLTNPELVMKNANKLLKYDGRILLSIPNMCHSGILAELYANKFQYRELGLLDKTHIHCFSYHSLCKMIDNCDNIVEIYDSNNADLIHSEFNFYNSILPSEILNLIKNKDLGNVYQFVFTLVKRDFYKENLNMTITDKLNYKDKFLSTLYLDYGNGFTQENTILIENSNNSNKIVNITKIPNGVVNLRFDPAEEQIYLIKNLEILLDHNKFTNFTTNGETIDNYILFNTYDPQIFIDGVNGKSTIKIECEFQVVTETFMEIYLHKQIINTHDIEALYKTISLNENTIAELSSCVVSKDEEISNFNHEIGLLNVDVQVLNHSISRKTNDLILQNAEIERLTNLYNQTVLQLQENNSRLHQLQLSYDDIRFAFFWRLTKPCRVVLDFLKRNKFIDLCIKGLKSIKNQGLKITLIKVKRKIFKR